jgi:hypothetical protein
MPDLQTLAPAEPAPKPENTFRDVISLLVGGTSGFYWLHLLPGQEAAAAATADPAT